MLFFISYSRRWIKNRDFPYINSTLILKFCHFCPKHNFKILLTNVQLIHLHILEQRKRMQVSFIYRDLKKVGEELREKICEFHQNL